MDIWDMLGTAGTVAGIFTLFGWLNLKLQKKGVLGHLFNLP
jgi:ATP-dependent protease HslVU (ClpYQ) peptidase subunit